MSLTLPYMVIARNLSDVPAHRSVVLRHAGLPAGGWLWQAGVAISQRDSFASLGMTNARLFTGRDARGRGFEDARVQRSNGLSVREKT